jgi:hypothetical protein
MRPCAIHGWNTSRSFENCGFNAATLGIVYSPFRQLFRPILAFIDRAKEEDPEHLVAVVVPELVQPRWWEYLLYNHSAAGLKAALLLNGAKHGKGLLTGEPLGQPVENACHLQSRQKLLTPDS